MRRADNSGKPRRRYVAVVGWAMLSAAANVAIIGSFSTCAGRANGDRKGETRQVATSKQGSSRAQQDKGTVASNPPQSAAPALASMDELRSLVRLEKPRDALATLARIVANHPRGAEPDPELASYRYLEGRLHEDLRDHAAARTAFDEAVRLGLHDTALADARKRALKALTEIDCVEALRRSAEDGSGSATIGIAKCAHRERQRDRAIEILKRATSANTASTVAGRVLLAKYLLEARASNPSPRSARGARGPEPINTRGARGPESVNTLLRDVLVRFPDRAARTEAAALFASAGSQAPFTLDEKLTRAERFLRVRKWPDAITELEALPRAKRSPQRARIAHLLGTALFRSRRRYPDAARVLTESYELGHADSGDDGLNAARALLRASRSAESVRLYQKIAREQASNKTGAEAEYRAALVQIDGDDRTRARGRLALRAFLDGPRGRIDADLRRNAAWALAFAAFEQAEYVAASGLFQTYIDAGGPSPMERGRGLYWKARSLEQQARRDDAIATFVRARDVDPLHWYGMLAQRRLAMMNAPEATAGANGTAPLGPGSGAGQRTITATTFSGAVRFYLTLGLDEDARDQFGAGAAAALSPSAQVDAYHALQEYARPYHTVLDRHRALLTPPVTDASRWAWDAVYPRAFPELVDAGNAENRLPQGLLYSLMRQESGFDPDVVSYADAYGLMQLLPDTARREAAHFSRAIEPEDLFEPAINIRLAAAHVMRLLRDHGHPVLAIAAYNAGSARINQWLRENGNDLDLFVEQISIEQTHNYVRRVVSHWLRYAYLGRGDALAFNLPWAIRAGAASTASPSPRIGASADENQPPEAEAGGSVNPPLED